MYTYPQFRFVRNTVADKRNVLGKRTPCFLCFVLSPLIFALDQDIFDHDDNNNIKCYAIDFIYDKELLHFL